MTTSANATPGKSPDELKSHEWTPAFLVARSILPGVLPVTAVTGLRAISTSRREHFLRRSAANQRIDHRELGETAQVSVRRPELANSVLFAQRCDPRVASAA